MINLFGYNIQIVNRAIHYVPLIFMEIQISPSNSKMRNYIIGTSIAFTIEKKKMSKALIQSLKAQSEVNAASPSKRKRTHRIFVLKDNDKDIVAVIATSDYEFRERIKALVTHIPPYQF